MRVVLIAIVFCCFNPFTEAQVPGIKIKEKESLKLNLIPYSFLRLNNSISVISYKSAPSFSFKSPYRHLDQLGFVCKWELKLDDKLKKPLRFRLGSLDYVNQLEGKN